MAHKDPSVFPSSMILLILGLLEDCDRYGYQMIRELETYSDTTFLMCEGMLYPILHALERSGELSSYEAAAESGQQRKYYRLTKQGIRTLSRKRRELMRACAKMGKVVGGEACAER